MRRAIVALCALLLAAGGCNGGEQEPQATAISSPTPEPTPCVLEDASTDARERESEQPFSPVVDVRWDDSEGCPRIVFEFRDNLPGYEVAFGEEPFAECGSGEEIDTSDWDAGAFLSVRMEPSGGGDLETGEPTYDGPRNIAVDGEVLKHLRRICDFEAVYEWVIGLDEERPFAVSTFGDPSRLVIDISQR